MLNVRSVRGAGWRKQIVALFAATTMVAPAMARGADVAPDLAHQVVPTVARQLEDVYPFQDIARQYAGKLRTGLAQGKYNGLSAPDLAKALSEDLQAQHKDLHLGVLHSHQLYLQATGETTGNQPTEDAKFQQEERHRTNFGFTDVQVDSAHSTTYIRSRGSWWAERETFTIASGAMAMASQSDNVIIDIRDNGGGSGVVGRYLSSYFFGDGDERFYLAGFGRTENESQQEWTYAFVPGKRMPHARLFILVNKNTASAAEGFAYAMQKMHRATIVGDTTAGAGIARSSVPLRDDLVLFLPVKMVVAPHTTTGWEGTGVVPDVAAEGRDARAVAEELIRAPQPAKAG